MAYFQNFLAREAHVRTSNSKESPRLGLHGAGCRMTVATMTETAPPGPPAHAQTATFQGIDRNVSAPAARAGLAWRGAHWTPVHARGRARS